MLDQLTNLPGRVRFFQALERCVARALQAQVPVGLVLLRIHKLRTINSELGYDGGDAVLRELSVRLASCLRASDVLARISGAEFALILPSLIGIGQIELAANKINELSREPLEVCGQAISLQVTIGIAMCPDHARDPRRLLARAESALSTARSLGRGYVVYEKDQNSDRALPLSLETELESAIENGELALYYQPKIDMRKREVIGLESLSRWTSASYGAIAPDVFIGIAERSGLILPLTLLTLNVALRQCRELQDAFGDVSVAINLSPVILNDHEVDELVRRALSIWGTDPRQVILEVTEGAMMVDPSSALETLTRLRSTGVNISIDDFGTGYSSLAYLKNLPVNELKIDKSFVMHLVDDDGDARIVKSVIDLAHNFKLAVVAEGIENQQTFDRLASMGCEYAQGFHMGRPMPFEDIVTWFTESTWGKRSAPAPDKSTSSNPTETNEHVI